MTASQFLILASLILFTAAGVYDDLVQPIALTCGILSLLFFIVGVISALGGH